MKEYLVIDVGGTYTKYALMDEKDEFLELNKILTVKDTQEHFLDMLIQLYEKYEDRICGIALSAPGMIDAEKGYMYNGGSLFCISNLNITEELGRRCNVPVTIENDARCAAFAELKKGSLKECKNAIVVLCGTAIGGAVICDGRVIRGENYFAGEFSHILTNSFDPMNPRSILAENCGVPSLLKEVAVSKGLTEVNINGEKIFQMAENGDEDTIACIRSYARRLAVQLMNYQFIFDPERFAIGGGISRQPMLIEMIREEIERLNKIYPHSVPCPQICTCQFFNESNLIGALYVYKEKYHS